MTYILDRFTGADDSLIHSRTTETGETWTAQVSAMKIASNRAICSVQSTRAIATVPTAWADVSVEATMRVGNTEAGLAGLVLRWSDSNNYWLFRMYHTGGNEFRLYEVNGGVETLRAFDNPAFDSAQDISIRAVCNGSTISVTATQDVTILSISYNSATHNQSATVHGVMLEKQADNVDDILMWSGTGSPPPNPLYSSLILSSPANLQIFQRSGTTGDIAIVGTFSGDGEHDIEASFNGGAYVTIAEGVTGAFTGTLTDQSQGQGSLTVRLMDDTNVSATATNVGIGDVFVLAGQSNMSGRGTVAQTWSHATLYASQYGNNYTWTQLAAINDSNTGQVDAVSSDVDAAQNYIPRLATAFLADQGVPVAFVPCAMNATAIVSWLPGADHQDRTTLYGSMVYRALAVGGVKAVLFHQGESDATITDFTTGATYKTRLLALAAAVWADLGVPVVVSRIHCWDGAPSTTQENVDEINAAMAYAAAENSHILLGPHFDSPTPVTTSLHFTTDADMINASSRMWSALENLFYSTSGITYDDFLDALPVLLRSALGIATANLDTQLAALAVVDANVDAIKLITDDLDVSAVTQVAASSAGHLTITAGLTFSEAVTGLTIPADWVTAIWTLNHSELQADTAAVIQLRVSNPADGDDGLQRLNGATVAVPITAADGTLTVTQASGRIDIYLTDEMTALLSKATGLGWDVKFIDADDDSTGRRGTADVVFTETMAVA